MATRSTITIKSDWQTVHLYRHWDGYPEFTGRHLSHVLKHLPNLEIEGFVAKLITAKESEPLGSGRYQFTNKASSHSDREWHYEIDMKSAQEPTVEVWHRPIGEDFMHLQFKGGLFAYRAWISKRFRALIRHHKVRNAA